jgi:hypothetical protein
MERKNSGPLGYLVITAPGASQASVLTIEDGDDDDDDDFSSPSFIPAFASARASASFWAGVFSASGVGGVKSV